MYNGHHRFILVPLEFESKRRYYHCCTKREWQVFLNSYFEKHLNIHEIDFKKTTDNASFRLTGLEIKIGLLLATLESEQGGQSQTLSGAILPSIVIDTVLSLFSIFEGLGTLSHIAHTKPDFRGKLIEESQRGGKIMKGIRAVVRKNPKKVIQDLRDLRDRCMHQDRADLLPGKDYEHTFGINKIVEPISLLHEFLEAMADSNSPLPNTNLSHIEEHIDIPRF